MIFDAELEESLQRLASLMQNAEEPWWIIGSVAVALSGGKPGEVHDIDVVLSHADAERIFRELKLENMARGGNALFCSDLLARWAGPPIAIELMAGLKVNRGGVWRSLSIRSREEARPGLFVPGRDELRDILVSFGREKDLRRAATLD